MTRKTREVSNITREFEPDTVLRNGTRQNEVILLRETLREHAIRIFEATEDNPPHDF